MSILFALFSFIVFDAEFIKVLLDYDEAAWQRLSDESIPPEQDLQAFASLANALDRWVPKSLLKKQAQENRNAGKVVRLEGQVIAITQYDNVYRCTMMLNDGTTADVFVPSIPQGLRTLPTTLPGEALNANAAAFGIYVKTYDGMPLFAAPGIEWYPDTWLGNLGFDVALLDKVPVSRVVGIEQNKEETNRRLFKLTEADAEPFYALLQVISSTPEGWLEEEAKRFNLAVLDVFNRPTETRGKPILLQGTAKRIVSTPVQDNEVQALFGIDHYYQIYLFTEQSRGNPLVVCVRSLPEGLAVLAAEGKDNFEEVITVTAVPYKLWIYESQAGQHYAPILLGQLSVWHPKPADNGRQMAASISFTVFLVLLFVWFACRLWVRGVRRKNRVGRI